MKAVFLGVACNTHQNTLDFNWFSTPEDHTCTFSNNRAEFGTEKDIHVIEDEFHNNRLDSNLHESSCSTETGRFYLLWPGMGGDNKNLTKAMDQYLYRLNYYCVVIHNSFIFSRMFSVFHKNKNKGSRLQLRSSFKKKNTFISRYILL